MARSGVPFLENLAAQECYHPLYGAAALVVLSAPGGLDEKGFNMANVSCAAENMLLAAHALGLGAVWTGIYPLEERIAAFRQLFGLPDTVTPLALLVLGHPADTPAPQDRFRPDRIHHDHW